MLMNTSGIKSHQEHFELNMKVNMTDFDGE